MEWNCRRAGEEPNEESCNFASISVQRWSSSSCRTAGREMIEESNDPAGSPVQRWSPRSCLRACGELMEEICDLGMSIAEESWFWSRVEGQLAPQFALHLSRMLAIALQNFSRKAVGTFSRVRKGQMSQSHAPKESTLAPCQPP